MQFWVTLWFENLSLGNYQKGDNSVVHLRSTKEFILFEVLKLLPFWDYFPIGHLLTKQRPVYISNKWGLKTKWIS